MRALRNEALKLAEISDAEIDFRYQSTQSGPRQIHHGIRSVNADHTRLRKPLQKLCGEESSASSQIQGSDWQPLDRKEGSQAQ